MDCIIKNTKTVDEFKRVRASMEERAKRQYGVLWIEYESGHAWQYRETEAGLEWY